MTLARRLTQGWQVCRVAPGSSAPGDAADWLDTDEPLTAAASLRKLGRWTVASAGLRFDADDWYWRVRFEVPANGHRWQLRFDGLATRAEVWLDGEPLLTSDNMFLAHEVEAASRLLRGTHELLIRCRSVDEVLATRRPRPRWRAPMVEHQQLRWVRTTLLGRTPGWSPAAAPVGPWRDVWLEPVPVLRIEDRVLVTDHDGSNGTVDLHGRITGLTVQQVELACRRDGVVHRCTATLAADGSFSARLVIKEAAAWWPHTQGVPALYDAELVCTLADATVQTLALGRLGLRRIEVDRRGDGFGLVVNGEPVFARGACWTPLDAVSLRASPEALQAAVAQVREAGMNLLRLAGNMVAEEPAFYAACDEAGVMVWQEFMFANMDYPDDEAFLAQAMQEVTQQLQRWQPHACMAVLCGNSEGEQQAAMWGASRMQWQPALFHEHIAEASRRWMPSTTYWPSSAHGGAFPFRPDTGTTSYYGVGAYLRPLDDARASGLRFATECLAFANVPSAATLARLPEGGAGGDTVRPHMPGWKAGVPRDLGAGWDFDDVRDHYFERLTGARPERVRAEDGARYLAISRWVSGQVMADAFAQWRAAGSRCNGALVWFLRDLRPGAGWGLLDDQGVPKAAWHLLRRQLQPLMVGLVDGGLNGYDLHLVNEHPREVQAVLALQAWRGGTAVVAQARRPVSLPARSVQCLPLVGELDGFADLGHAYRFGPPACDLLTAWLTDEAGTPLAEATALPQGLSMSRTPHIGLRATTARHDDRVELTVSVDACAVGLHVDALGCMPDDDYLTLLPGQARRITLRALPGTTLPRTVRATVGALNTEQTCTVVA